MDTPSKATKDKKRDKDVDMTFPASDAIAHGVQQVRSRRAGPWTANPRPYQGADRPGATWRRPQTGGKEVMEGSEPVDRPSRETVAVRQGTGPRAMVSVLFISLALAALAGLINLGYFVWS